MENPFLKRATEHLRNEEAFLAVVSPEPVRHYIGPAAEAGVLFDRLVVIRGTPGSGKTTLARLFEYPTIAALLRNKSLPERSALVAALSECTAISAETPAVLACRVSLESDYREIWNFPYAEDLRLALTLALIQARAVLLWLRNLKTAGVDLAGVKFIVKREAVGALEAIGGDTADGLEARARELERDLYRIVGALVHPPLNKLPAACTDPYQPFDVIEAVSVPGPDGEPCVLRPLVILDDAHILHPSQFAGLQRSLARRELRVARWILTRLDILEPSEVLAAVAEVEDHRPALPGVNTAREITTITFQSVGSDKRNSTRRSFRSMAKDMSDRYLRMMPLFTRGGLTRFGNLLSTEVPPLAPGVVDRTRQGLESLHAEFGTPQKLREELLSKVDDYLTQTQKVDEAIRYTMARVLVHRTLNRVPQQTLFEAAPEPSKPVKADIGVYDAARLFLHHEHGRPYYCGIDDLCDASSENAEQFLHLAAELVEAAATNVIRSKTVSVEPGLQTKLLKRRATKIITEWDFPNCASVRRVVDRVAERCRLRSLEPNAPLGAGASAYGILQEEFDSLPEKHPQLARVLMFAIAYNAVGVVAQHSCKNKTWCLLLLGGIPLLHHGLTLKRGGFVEGTVRELEGFALEAER